jgi:hypothetical protein
LVKIKALLCIVAKLIQILQVNSSHKISTFSIIRKYKNLRKYKNELFPVFKREKKGKNKVDKVWIVGSRIQKKNDIRLKKFLMNIDLMNIE